MPEIFHKLARDPNCILAVDAANGGTWYSILSPDDGTVPSTTLRNFSTEPAAWNDVRAAYANTDWAHDFTFEFEFEISSAAELQLFYGTPASNMFGLYQYSTGRINLFTALLKPVTLFTNYLVIELHPTGSFLTGRHIAKAVIAGTTLSIYLDNVLITTVTDPLRNIPASFIAPVSNFGYIYSAFIRDDTTGKTVWNYPTWEEKVRLLTLYNVNTRNGYFEQAQTGVPYGFNSKAITSKSVTALEKRTDGVYINSGRFDATTGDYTGEAGYPLKELLILTRTLTTQEILLYFSHTWQIQCVAGTVNLQTVGFENLLWTLPDGSTSTATTINQTVTAGILTCRYTGLVADSRLTIYNSPAISYATINSIDLPRVKTRLEIYNLSGLTGAISDLPDVSYRLALSGLPSLTGTTADIPRVTSVLFLISLPGLTGPTTGLPANTGEIRIASDPLVTGALAVTPTNQYIQFYGTGATPKEYDQTVQNIVDGGMTNGTLIIGAGTSAGDANIQTLRDRGWTVSIRA